MGLLRQILVKYFGDYVEGLSKETLKVSLWNGDVELTDIQLKPEAFKALKLPIKVKAVRLGSVKLKVPWWRPTGEPVIVELDRILILTEPSTSVEEAKSWLVREEEEKIVRSKGDNGRNFEERNVSWLGSLIDTVVGNLKLSVTDIHIRYEDEESNAGHPFAAGLTLAKLAAVTVDKIGKETFVAGGALDRLQKSGKLNRLSFYLDTDTKPSPVEKLFTELVLQDWSKQFLPGIKEKPSSYEGEKPELIKDHNYVLQLGGGAASYFKCGQKDTRSSDEPAQAAIVKLDDVSTSLTEKQYRDALKLTESISTISKCVKYAHYRPNRSVKEDRKGWWHYAYTAVLEDLKKASGHLAWHQMLSYSRMRKRYVSKYIEALQANPGAISINDNKGIKEFDRQLDSEIIIQWRMLAHTFVDQVRKKGEERQAKRSWWSFGWFFPNASIHAKIINQGGRGGGDGSDASNKEFTDNDWKRVNQIIGYEEGKPSPKVPGEDQPNMLHTLVEVHMGHIETKLLSSSGISILELAAEGLECGIKLYPETKVFDVGLNAYKISTPEGLLGESAHKEESLNATFTLSPRDKQLDWSLKAKAAPCHVTVRIRSISRVTQFFFSNEVESRDVALQTVAALQSTVNEASKNAQQQLNDALKNKPKFVLDLDIAPKITIPTDFYPDGQRQCKMFLNLGYCSIKTLPADGSTDDANEENQLYMRFHIGLKDVSASLIDGDYDWRKQCNLNSATGRPYVVNANLRHRLKGSESLEDCGHNDPDDFEGKKEGAKGKEGGASNNVQEAASSSNAIQEKGKAKQEVDSSDGDLFFLPMLKKTGMTVAVVQICVSHPKYPTSRVAVSLQPVEFQFSPARYHRIVQVFEVLSGGSDEDANQPAFRPRDSPDFDGQMPVLPWKTPGAVSGLLGGTGEKNDSEVDHVPESTETDQTKLAEQEIMFFTGVLDEVKIVISNSRDIDFTSAKQLLLAPENPLLELRAIETKVQFIMRKNDILVGAALRALEIEDKFHGHVSHSCSYLAGSYMKQERKGKGVHDSERPAMSSSSHHSNWKNRVQDRKLQNEGRKGGMKLLTIGSHNNSINAGSSKCSHCDTSGDERYFDANDGNGYESSSRIFNSQRHGSSSDAADKFYDAADKFDDAEDDHNEPLSFKRNVGLLPEFASPESSKDDHDVTDNEELKGFVKAQVIMTSPESPMYASIGKEVQVSLPTLSFYCNRPTVIAALDLVTAITAEVQPKKDEDPTPTVAGGKEDAQNSSEKGTKDASGLSDIDSKDENGMGQEADKEEGDDKKDDYSLFANIDGVVEDVGEQGNPKIAPRKNDSVVKGVLGKGKDRVVFSLVLDMERAEIVLNKEDGSSLSTFSQGNVHTDVKIYPASWGVKAALGNLCISDDYVKDYHHGGIPIQYICDMRNPGGSSVIELEFVSFNEDDPDYEGYEFSVTGKLSEVRLVFLNRFIQEITAYFMGLVPQNSGYVLKLKDRASNYEKRFSQSEIQGQPSLKLDISLLKPIIIMPRGTYSTDFMELDILHINIRSSSEWFGGGKEKLGAIRLETIKLDVEGVSLTVGVGGKVGSKIFDRARGIGLVVRRPLRDLWHKVPVIEATVKIEELRASLSDKDSYQVITECVTQNMAETPDLPGPTLCNNTPSEEEEPNAEDEAQKLEEGANGADVVIEDPQAENNQREEESGSSAEEPYSTIKVGVEIDLVKLGLYVGDTRDTSLATIQVNGVWASYEANNIDELVVKASLDRFILKDERDGTDPEMQYMIGHADDQAPNISEGGPAHAQRSRKEKNENDTAVGISSTSDGSGSELKMIVVDAKLSPTQQEVSLRIQRPRLVVAFDFLLAVGKFFVPSMPKKGDGTILDMENGMFLNDRVYKQTDEEIRISPKKPLIADYEGVQEYIYDGQGNTLRLPDRHDEDLSIFVGDGKRLVFRNVAILNGDQFDSSIHLGSNSSCSASQGDGVFLKGPPEESDTSSTVSSHVEDKKHNSQEEAGKPPVKIVFDLKAIGPELILYDRSVHRPSGALGLPERHLRARMNDESSASFSMNGDDMEVTANLNGLKVESTSGVDVLEPFIACVTYSQVTGKQNIHVIMTEINTNFSFSILQLILRLQDDVMSTMRIISEQITVECSEFDKIWADDGGGYSHLAFWRPRPPTGFAVLGDCVTPLDVPPAKGVLAVNMALVRSKEPTGFKCVWSSRDHVPEIFQKPSEDGKTFQLSERSERKQEMDNAPISISDDEKGENRGCCVWLPIPPEGYVAMGCVVWKGQDEPPKSATRCVLAALISPCSMRDCINIMGRHGTADSDSQTQSAFWRADNSIGTFFLQPNPMESVQPQPYDLRHAILNHRLFTAKETVPSSRGKPQTRLSNTLSPIANTTGSSTAYVSFSCDVIVKRACAIFYDDFGGLMVPILDFTVEDMRMEQSSTDANFCLTATTYNSKFDKWEPLIEPCKVEIRYGDESDPQDKVRARVARVRISDFNLNISVANTNTLLEAYSSWMNLSKLEACSKKQDKSASPSGRLSSGRRSSGGLRGRRSIHSTDMSTIRDNSFIVFHNETGEELWLRNFERSGKFQVSVRPGKTAIIEVPVTRCVQDSSHNELAQGRSEKVGAVGVQKNKNKIKVGAIEASVTENGPWSPVELNYGLGPAPWRLEGGYLASEMVVHNGVKHLSIRPLLTLMNETEYRFEARLHPVQPIEPNDTTWDGVISLGTLEPHSTVPCPIKVDYVLQVKPARVGPVYNSGVAHEWSSVRPPSNELRISELQNTELILNCPVSASSSTMDAKDIWLSLQCKSSEVGKSQPRLDPIEDWSLIVSAPLELVNFLPVTCKYTVSEKADGKELMELQSGSIEPGNSKPIFLADLRKALYLKWIPEGGWKPKGNDVLISQPGKDPAKEVIVTDEMRDLTIHMQCDNGNRDISARVIRFYVPCWLDSVGCPSLKFKLVGVHRHRQERLKSDKSCLNGIDGASDMHQYPTMISDYNCKTMGIKVALLGSESTQYGPLAYLDTLGNPDGNVDLRAVNDKNSHFRFLVTTTSHPQGFAQTQVVRIRPYTLFTNRIGLPLELKQAGNDRSMILNPWDKRTTFAFPAFQESLQLQIRLKDLSEWSNPFPIDGEGILDISLRHIDARRQSVRLDVHGYDEGSRFMAVFQLGPSRGPYRIENRTGQIEIMYRQGGLDDNAWRSVRPHSSTTFAWEKPLGEKLLEVIQVGRNTPQSVKIDLDKMGDHPMISGDNSGSNICIRVLDAPETKVVRFFDPEVKIQNKENGSGNETEQSVPTQSAMEPVQGDQDRRTEAPYKMKIIVGVGKFGLSIVDQQPRELIFLVMEDVNIVFATDLRESVSRFTLTVRYLQADNQLPLTPMPVLLAPELRPVDYVIETTASMNADTNEADQVYQDIGLKVTKSAWRINVHEALIWAIWEMCNNLHLDRLALDSEIVQVDPEILIKTFEMTEVRLKVSAKSSPDQRPQGKLGIWGPIVTALVHITEMPIILNPVSKQNQRMRKSQVPAKVFQIRVGRDHIFQFPRLLTCMNFFSVTSSSFTEVRRGIQKFSKDDDYKRSKNPTNGSYQQEMARNDVTGMRDGLVLGAKFVGRGLASGVKAAVTKPIKGAQQDGFAGFIKGAGKGVAGFMSSTTGGVLDGTASILDGTGKRYSKVISYFHHDIQKFERSRLPRAITGPGVLTPYDPYAARGQAILQLSQSGDIIKSKGVSKNAGFLASDIYQGHFDLPNNLILMLTNRRVLMLLSPASDARDKNKELTDPACTSQWEIHWDDLQGMKANGQSVMASIQVPAWQLTQVVSCYSPNDSATPQATEIFRAVQQQWQAFCSTSKTKSISDGSNILVHFYHIKRESE